jgi:succinyl-CoA synthetase alpha subunit
VKNGESSPVIVQGATGRYGSFHTKLMLDYKTRIAAGVTPGKGGSTVHGIPVYDEMEEAVRESDSRVSIIFVPAPNFLTAAKEALNSGIKMLVAITEHVPVKDALSTLALSLEKSATVIGPNTPGVIIPGVTKVGIMPAQPFSRGHVAVFSRSGTLTYEVCQYLTDAGLGQRVALGIGGDPINCTTLVDCLEWAQQDQLTKGIVVVGEIGGDAEERAAQYVNSIHFRKPVVAYVAGRHAPREKRMGHAGAIIYGSYGTAESKIQSFTSAGVGVAKTPSEIPDLMKAVLGK